jgi:hypothetical protein
MGVAARSLAGVAHGLDDEILTGAIALKSS